MVNRTIGHFGFAEITASEFGVFSKAENCLFSKKSWHVIPAKAGIQNIFCGFWIISCGNFRNDKTPN